MNMHVLPVIAALLVGPASVGCSNSTSEAPASSASSAYPTDAAKVTSDPSYKLGVISGLTGIRYYVRRLAKDEVATMPKECVISDENTSVLVVPIKDGKIVEWTIPDHGSYFAQTPEEILNSK